MPVKEENKFEHSMAGIIVNSYSLQMVSKVRSYLGVCPYHSLSVLRSNEIVAVGSLFPHLRLLSVSSCPCHPC